MLLCIAILGHIDSYALADVLDFAEDASDNYHRLISAVFGKMVGWRAESTARTEIDL
jgi:N-acyl-L-homoserine lactone synthetase